MENEKQEIDFNLIRECLVEYAEELGRPYFDMCVVKRVTRAFVNNVDDVLKPTIESMINDKLKRNVGNRRRELIMKFAEGCSLDKLAKIAGVPHQTAKRIANFETVVTDEQWGKFLNAFEVLSK